MSQTVVALPRLIELRSNYDNTILRCVKEEGKQKGLVQFRGEQVGEADAKFEVHKSKNGNGLVHIRSCYNNKYLVLHPGSNWIAAEAKNPEEDITKRSCTLFKPTSVDGDPTKIRLTNVYLENYLCFWRATDKSYYGCIWAWRSDPGSVDVFKFIDWQSLVFLPKYVAFQGPNGKFLRAHWQDKHRNYLQFWDDNMEDYPSSVGNEIVENGNGTICIRNLFYDRYWRSTPGWIWADAENPKSYGTEFVPVKYPDDTIALRNVATNKFCTGLTTEGKENCLDASTLEMNSQAKLKVHELVISKKIEDVNYRLIDARIYDESIIMMDSASNKNHGTETDEQTFHFSYKHKTSNTWSGKISVKASIQTTLKVGLPSIFDGEVTVGYEVAGEYMWGETKEEEVEKSFDYTAKIPPKTKVTVRVTASRGTCDIPFSYTKREVLYTGEPVVTIMDDGVYNGINNYNYYTEVKHESLIEDHDHEVTGFKKVAKLSPSGEVIPL